MPRANRRRNQGMRNDDNEGMMGPEIHETDPENYGGELTSLENSEEEVSESSEEEIEIGGDQLGLENEINPQVNGNLQEDEDAPLTPHNSDQSAQHSPKSGVDSVSSSNFPVEINLASDLLMAVLISADVNKTRITEAAISSMEELTRKALEGEPLWKFRGNDGTEILNESEYIREFQAFDATLREIMRMIEMGDPQLMANLDGNNESTSEPPQNPKFGREADPDILKTEASREVGFVNMSPTSVIECLMDVEQWSTTFSNIVTRATLLGVLSTKVPGNYDETLQVIKAEFHMPTPCVPARECQFARYCKQIGSGTWGVVDVSLENLFPYPIIKFRRRPSGCLIQEMPNGNSKVTWVEHVEVNNTFDHGIFQPLLHQGFTFSAKCWVATLIRHSEWIATLMSGNRPSIDGVLVPQIGKESLLRLSGRMMRSFYRDNSASTDNLWMPFPLHGGEEFKVMTKSISITTSGRRSTTIAFTTSLQLPFPPKSVFNFLRHEDSRNKWDLLAHGHLTLEIAQVIIGESPENCVSVMQVKSSPTKTEILYLQETNYDPTGAYVVYAPIDVPAMTGVLNGANPDNVIILPSGFVIHPDRPVTKGEEADGSLLTLAFHIMDGIFGDDPIPSLSVNTIHRILTDTANLIVKALSSDDY